MYKQISYLEEDVKNSKIIVFCVVIAVITIILVVITGVLAFNAIKKPNKNQELAVTQNLKDENVQQSTKPKPQVENENKQESVSNNNEQVDFPNHNFNLIMQSQLPQYSDAIAQKVVNVYYEKAKKIYLTFDDGPSNRTPEILDVLDKYNVKATFFVLGQNVKSKPELVKREYDSGHFIANHGYTHNYSAIYRSSQTVLDEYNKTLAEIQKAIGVPEYNPHLFRFPGGSAGGKYSKVKKEAIKYLKQNQITHTNWNCLTGDAEGKTTVDAQWKELIKTAAGDDNLVILMHDANDKKATVQLLPKIIEYYQSQGYEFANYYDVMKEN